MAILSIEIGQPDTDKQDHLESIFARLNAHFAALPEHSRIESAEARLESWLADIAAEDGAQLCILDAGRTARFVYGVKLTPAALARPHY